MSGRPYAEVIGDPIAQSKSPTIHNFWLGKLGVDAQYRASHITTADLADYFAERRRTAEWRGCNVTMPHKAAVIPLLDRLDPEAERIGAVNTVVPEPDGLLYGHNTDASGFIEPIRPLIGEQTYAFAYVIGTGGAARAIIDKLFAEDFLIFSISRDLARARRELGRYLGEDEDFLLELGELRPGNPLPADEEIFSLVVNATPLGMAGHDPLRIGWAAFRANAIAYDIVTAPVDTEFLREARAHGMRTIDGFAMLIGQAAVAFEKFFGQPAPREFDSELRALLTA